MKSYAGAILLAAGTGSRLGSKTRKGLVKLGGKPLFLWSLEALLRSPEIGQVVLTAHAGDRESMAAGVKRFAEKVRVVTGGATRQDSVACGLAALDPSWPVALVHDAARPFLTPSLVRDCAASARDHGSGIAAVEVKD